MVKLTGRIPVSGDEADYPKIDLLSATSRGLKSIHSGSSWPATGKQKVRG